MEFSASRAISDGESETGELIIWVNETLLPPEAEAKEGENERTEEGETEEVEEMLAPAAPASAAISAIFARSQEIRASTCAFRPFHRPIIIFTPA